MQLAWMTGSDDTVFDVVFVPKTPSSMMFHPLEACRAVLPRENLAGEPTHPT